MTLRFRVLSTIFGTLWITAVVVAFVWLCAQTGSAEGMVFALIFSAVPAGMLGAAPFLIFAATGDEPSKGSDYEEML